MSSTGALDARQGAAEARSWSAPASSGSSSARCGGGSAPQVTVVEFLDRILPGMDGEVARQFQRMLEKQGIAFKLSSKVTRRSTRAAGAQGQGRAGRGRRRARRSRPTSCWSRSAACPTPRGSASRRSASKRDNRGRIVVDPHFAHQRRRHLCHRRRDRRADAGAQGARRKASRSPRSSPARPAT